MVGEILTGDYGEQALEGVAGKDGVTWFLAEDAHDIGGADIAATVLADIDAAGAARDVTEGDGAEEVTDDYNQTVNLQPEKADGEELVGFDSF